MDWIATDLLAQRHDVAQISHPTQLETVEGNLIFPKLRRQASKQEATVYRKEHT